MTVRFTRRAVANIEAIAAFVRRENPQAAAAVKETIERSLDVLRTFPEAGRPQNWPGLRKLVKPRFGYLIYYRIEDRTRDLVIVAVRHPARRRPSDD